ncbi:kinase-like protein, partial [Aureobasidium melanogenum]
RQVRPTSSAQHDAAEDQENIPPPTFKRDRHHDFKYLGKPEKIALHSKSQPVEETPMSGVSHQSPRRALTSISNNTPVRPAPPPPPKMSVLDAATKTAGASTTKSKKRRQHILINGKLFTQMNKVGKGGSSDVYCVMAENYKLFALKKVKLEDCDESAMRGFKGEIDLLEKLADVDRVIRLFDWELDNEKQILSVLMEKGDQDLNRILTIALNGSDPKFDPVLTRFYWKEMLECVQAVHDYDIVHSDLKPANFLSVQGKLKLIDFGIANAIDIAHTVNVHRDSHIGTPNYMSPESILDTNAPTPGSERTSNNGSRLMKIGKPSDVWSLGCILYQMVYGRPPFAHIANQISRIMAITNSKVVIEFPDKGVGGVTVPSALKGTLRRCLQRDLHARPTVKQLLSHSDPWLYPDVGNAVAMSEDLLAQIIDKVVERCKDPKRGIPSPDEVKQYPASFMSKIREMVERDGVVG